MHNLLAIETSEETCSAALRTGGDCMELFESEPRKHSELILPMIDRLMAEAGLQRGSLDAVAFGRGPGSFTGVRIATAVAQGIGFALDIPVVPVSTLQALAQGAYRQAGARQVLAALDARMQEVYWGAFRCDDNGLVDPLGGEAVCAPQRVRVPTPGHWVGAGSGWASYGEVLVTQCRMESADIYPDQKPHAADVARLAAESFRLGNAVSAEQAVPVYLRDNVAVHPGQKA